MRFPYLCACAGILLLRCDSVNPSTAPKVWSAVDIRDQAIAGGTIAGFSASDWVTLRGNPIPMLSPPYGPSPRLQSANRDGLNVMPAFSEGKTAAYAVAEAWQNIPQLWIQPWYRFVTSYNPANPAGAPLPSAMPIVDIDTTSWFYSPFWELIYVVVPADTPPDKYLSASQLFQDNLEMHRGGSGLVGPLAPGDILPAVAQSDPSPVRPFSNDPIGTAPAGLNIPIALKGATRTSTLYSSGLFSWDSTGVVDEVPLFVFARVDASGQTVPFGLPNVIGTGPIGSGRPARLTASGMPQFGNLSRVYLTLLPPTAGVFIPTSQSSLRSYFASLGGIRVDPINPAIEARTDAKDYSGRVALNSASCFSNPATFPSACQWLDSQAALEINLGPGRLLQQDLLLTSPVLYFNGLKVGL